MRTCPRCHRDFPVVEGADAQQCPHCGLEIRARARAGGADAALAGSVDPAGAAGHAFRFTKRHYAALLLLWLPATIVDVIGSLTLTSYQAATGVGAAETLSLASQLSFLGVALPISIVVYGAKIAAWVGVGAYVADAVSGEGGHLAGLKGRGLQVMLLGLALAVLWLAGFILLIVPFLVFFHWFLFAPAALARPGSRIGAAMEESRRFARERRTFGFTALVLFVLLGIAFAYIVLASLISSASQAAGFSNQYVLSVAQSVLAWLLAPIISVLPASFFFLAKQAPEERPVDPSAPSAERFRTTKCPGCGTLVPYTATGQPVDVTCPVCGRAGKVL